MSPDISGNKKCSLYFVDCIRLPRQFPCCGTGRHTSYVFVRHLCSRPVAHPRWLLSHEQTSCSCGKFTDLLCSVTYLCKLADACAPGGLVSFGISPVWLPEICCLPVEQPVGSHNQFHFGSITFTIRFRPGYFVVCVSPSRLPGTAQGSYPVALAHPFIHLTQPTGDINENSNNNYLH